MSLETFFCRLRVLNLALKYGNTSDYTPRHGHGIILGTFRHRHLSNFIRSKFCVRLSSLVLSTQKRIRVGCA